LDGELVAARTDDDAEPVLEPRQILVELPVERAGELVVVEGEDDVGEIGGARGRGLQFRSTQASLLAGRGHGKGSANRLCWPDRVIRTVTMSPIRPAVSSTMTGWSQGERPTSCPSARPGFSSSVSTARPTRLEAKARC